MGPIRRRLVGAVLAVASMAVGIACGGPQGAEVRIESDGLPSAGAPAAAVASPGGAAVAAQSASDAVVGPAFRSAIDPVTAADLPHSWRPGCPVAPDRLRRVEVTHLGFDGSPRQGVLIVHADHARAIVDVFSRLYANGFPIQQMVPVDVYGGSDDASMAANNTSAFNCRQVTGGTRYSEHSYGWAIDVNPVQNPYVRGTTVLPPGGRTDRSPGPGVITAGDATVQAFAAIGWSWGGYWSTVKDYQHFSATNR
jgi:hypothetical protein